MLYMDLWVLRLSISRVMIVRIFALYLVIIIKMYVCIISHCLGKGHDTHYIDVIMSAIASQITSLTIIYSIGYSGADQRKHQSCAPLAFVRGIHRWPVNSPYKWPVTRKMFPFDDVIMNGTRGMLLWLVLSDKTQLFANISQLAAFYYLASDWLVVKQPETML